MHVLLTAAILAALARCSSGWKGQDDAEEKFIGEGKGRHWAQIADVSQVLCHDNISNSQQLLMRLHLQPGWQGETFHEKPTPKFKTLSWDPRIFHAENLLSPGEQFWLVTAAVATPPWPSRLHPHALAGS